MKKLLATTALVALTSTSVLAMDGGYVELRDLHTEQQQEIDANNRIANEALGDARFNARTDAAQDVQLLTLATSVGTNQQDIAELQSSSNIAAANQVIVNDHETRIQALENADMPSSGSGVTQEDIDNTIGEFNTNRDHPLHDGEGGTGSSTTTYETVGEAVQDALYYNGYNEVNINTKHTQHCLLYTSPSPRD